MANSLDGLSFRALFTATGDALILMDKMGCVIEANIAAQQLLGYRAHEITGLMIESLIPDYYVAYRRQDREQLHGHPEKRATDRGKGLVALCRDGRQLRIEINLCFLQPPEYPYILLTLYDTSWHFEQKQRISENAESQRAMIEQAIAGIVQTDLQGNITLTNHCFCDITGYSQEQLLGMNMLELTHPDDRPSHAELFRRLVNDNRPFTFEARYLRKNGHPAWVNMSVSRICNALRLPSSYVAVVIDVTDRTLTALALQASEERLRLAERAAELGIFDIDLSDDSVQCNQRILDIWGFSAEEPLSCEKFLAGIHPEDLAARNLVLAESLDPEGTGEYQTEYRVIHRQEHYETWVSLIGRAFFENGQANRIVGIVQDISKRKLNERKRQESGTAMRSLLKQQVAAQTASAIAHELNQPLTAISAYSEVARQALNGASLNIGQLDRALRGCVEQAQRAGRTLHELLNFLQQNKIVSESIDINILIKETIAIAQNDGFGGFATQLQLQNGLPPIIANRLQIQMVLINLLRNGVEAVREAGIAPAAIVITVQTIENSNMAQVTVHDNGPGMSAETAKRVFDPFFTTKSGGIGMGLAISRAMVEANGGQLWFELHDGLGAVFHFTLPFAL